MPVVLTPVLGSLITARENSPAHLPFISRRAGLVFLNLTLSYHPSAAVTDSMSPRTSFDLQPTCVGTSAVLSLIPRSNHNQNLNQ